VAKLTKDDNDCMKTNPNTKILLHSTKQFFHSMVFNNLSSYWFGNNQDFNNYVNYETKFKVTGNLAYIHVMFRMPQCGNDNQYSKSRFRLVLDDKIELANSTTYAPIGMEYHDLVLHGFSLDVKAGDHKISLLGNCDLGNLYCPFFDYANIEYTCKPELYGTIHIVGPFV